MSGSLPESPALRERRERTISALCDHFAQDRLSLEEFETRLDLAHKAIQPVDLENLLADIRIPESAAHMDVQPRRDAPEAIGEPGGDDTRLIIGIMGGAERRGLWRPGARNVAIGIMGGCVLDFREARLGPGVTDVFVLCIMGGAEIIVPPDLTVESNGFALMGGFDHFADDPPSRTTSSILQSQGLTTAGGDDGLGSGPPRRAGAPILRIHGFALMGGVEITVRLPGESARDAKRRRREERQLRRDSR
jgi:hypothetical protein